MMDSKKQNCKKVISLEEEYASFMKDASLKLPAQTIGWEKHGDIYKKYSLYESSKYKTTSSNTIK